MFGKARLHEITVENGRVSAYCIQLHSWKRHWIDQLTERWHRFILKGNYCDIAQMIEHRQTTLAQVIRQRQNIAQNVPNKVVKLAEAKVAGRRRK